MPIAIEEFVARQNLLKKWYANLKLRHLPDETKVATAYHEAGHAVINIILNGWQNTHLTIEDEDDNLGACHFVVITKLSLEQEAMSFLAGPIAELFTGEIYASGSNDDLLRVMDRIKWILEDKGEWAEDMDVHQVEALMAPVFNSICSSTSNLLDKHRKSIEIVATALCEERTMSGGRVGEILQS